MSNATVVEPAVEKDEQAVNLFDVGCLVNLSIGMWSGRKMITEEDLRKVGIDPASLPRDIVNYGRKLLVPKSELKVMNNIQQRARVYLAKWSVPFGISSSHFVPVKMLPSVEQELKGLKEEFFQRVDSFVARFADMKDTVKSQYPEFWEKCLKHCYPSSAESLRHKFKFNWYTFKVAGVGEMQEANIDELVAKEAVREERKHELRTQMKEEVGGFVEEYVNSMRAETVRFCELMAARINGKPFEDEEHAKKLMPRTVSYFRKYVDRFKQMNIFGDQEIEKMLVEFKSKFLGGDVTPKDFENDALKKAVTTTLDTIRQKAAAHGDAESKFINSLKRKVVI